MDDARVNLVLGRMDNLGPGHTTHFPSTRREGFVMPLGTNHIPGFDYEHPNAWYHKILCNPKYTPCIEHLTVPALKKTLGFAYKKN